MSRLPGTDPHRRPVGRRLPTARRSFAWLLVGGSLLAGGGLTVGTASAGASAPQPATERVTGELSVWHRDGQAEDGSPVHGSSYVITPVDGPPVEIDAGAIPAAVPPGTTVTVEGRPGARGMVGRRLEQPRFLDGHPETSDAATGSDTPTAPTTTDRPETDTSRTGIDAKGTDQPKDGPSGDPSSILLIACDETIDVSAAEARFDDIVNPIFETSSHGLRSFVPTVANHAACSAHGPEPAARLLGFEPDDFDRVAYLTDSTAPHHDGGAASIPGRRLQVFGFLVGDGAATMVHELGHLEGLFHANGITGCTFGVTPCQNVEYGHDFDPMGSNLILFSAASRDRLGWLFPTDVVDVAASGSWTIQPPTAAGGLQTVRVEAGSGTYYAETRCPTGPDALVEVGADRPVLISAIGIEVSGAWFDGTNPYQLAAVGPGETFTTPEGIQLHVDDGAMCEPATITVTLPASLPPALPVDVHLAFDAPTDTVTATWSAAPTGEAATSYDVRFSTLAPSEAEPQMPALLTSLTTAALSASVSGVPDGMVVVAVRAVAPTGSSGPATAAPVFVFRHVTAPSAMTVTEGSYQGAQILAIPLSLPAPRPTTTSRQLRIVPVSPTAIVGTSGTADVLPFVGDSVVSFPVGVTTATIHVVTRPDPIPEPHEVFAVQERRIDCMVTAVCPETWATVTLVTVRNDDTTFPSVPGVTATVRPQTPKHAP